MSTDRLRRPDVRWDGGDYSSLEFCPVDPAALAGSMNVVALLHTYADNAGHALDDADLDSWTGPAADTYRDFVQAFRADLTELSGALQSAVGAMEAAAPVLRAIGNGPATEAANTCNLARRDMSALDAAVKAGREPFFKAWIDRLTVLHVMSTGMGYGQDAINQTQSLLDGLAETLAKLDGVIRDIRFPKPGALKGVDGSLLNPVTKAEQSSGDDDAAQRALSSLTLTAIFGFPSLTTTLQNLTPAERTYVLEHLPPGTLDRLLAQLDPKRDHDTYEWLSRNLSLDQLDQLATADPNHVWHPSFTDDSNNYSWGQQGIANPPDASLGSLHQGQLGDCHLLASLGALQRSDPGFLNQHITTNPNGTYTVTLYKDGQPFQVTVTPDVPLNQNGNVGFAQNTGGDMNAYQIYEKAVAQASEQGLVDLNDQPGGYSDENGGWSDRDLAVLTGNHASSTPSSSVDAGQIQSALDHHQPVTIDTVGQGDKPLYNSGNNQYLVANHQYYVQSVNQNANPPTVTLVNPWGADDPHNGTLTITLDQLHQQTNHVQIGQP